MKSRTEEEERKMRNIETKIIGKQQIGKLQKLVPFWVWLSHAKKL